MVFSRRLWKVFGQKCVFLCATALLWWKVGLELLCSWYGVTTNISNPAIDGARANIIRGGKKSSDEKCDHILAERYVSHRISHTLFSFQRHKPGD